MARLTSGPEGPTLVAAAPALRECCDDDCDSDDRFVFSLRGTNQKMSVVWVTEAKHQAKHHVGGVKLEMWRCIKSSEFYSQMRRFSIQSYFPWGG